MKSSFGLQKNKPEDMENLVKRSGDLVCLWIGLSCEGKILVEVFINGN